MATIKRFEDIEAWQKARILASKMGAWIIYLNQSEHKGTKFKNRVTATQNPKP